MPGQQVALVTARRARSLDDDLEPLAHALGALAVANDVVEWDDRAVDWARFDLVVVRSTWDYAARREEFVAWADRVAAMTKLENPAAVLRWNTDKRYLRDLAAAGVPIAPTEWFEPGEPVSLAGRGEVVVKPAVSAGAKDTARYGATDLDGAEAHVGALQRAGRTVMVQPYLEAIDRAGETALVFIDGAFSHGLRKGALLEVGAGPVDGLYAVEDMAGRTPTPDEHDVARRAMAAAPGGSTLLYARVDLVPGPDGAPVLLELEVTEPSLFFAFGTGAAERLATAIATRLGEQ